MNFKIQTYFFILTYLGPDSPLPPSFLPSSPGLAAPCESDESRGPDE